MGRYIIDCSELQCAATVVCGPSHSLRPQVEEEVESQCLRQLSAALPGKQFVEAVNKFNSNVSYSGLNYAVTQDGLFVENKEKLINAALNALISKEGELPWQQSPLPPNTVAIPRHARYYIGREYGGAGGSVPWAEAAGGVQGRLPGLHCAAQVSRDTFETVCALFLLPLPSPSPSPHLSAQHARVCWSKGGPRSQDQE